MTGKYWKRICVLPAYMFLLSPSGTRVQKLEGGNWIDQHEAQQVVEAAEEELAELRADVERLQPYKTAYMEWSDKTDWVHETAEVRDLGKHRADVIRERFDTLKAKTETYCSYGDEGSEHTYYGDKAAIEAMTRLVSEVEGLKAECEGLRADAERYRTVRDFWPPQFEWIFEASFLDDQSSKYDSERASRMDGLVDAARTKETGHD